MHLSVIRHSLRISSRLEASLTTVLDKLLPTCRIRASNTSSLLNTCSSRTVIITIDINRNSSSNRNMPNNWRASTSNNSISSSPLTEVVINKVDHSRINSLPHNSTSRWLSTDLSSYKLLLNSQTINTHLSRSQAINQEMHLLLHPKEKVFRHTFPRQVETNESNPLKI